MIARFRFRNLPRFVTGALGDMWFRATNGNLTPVAGTKDEGTVPTIQADGTVAWETPTATLPAATAGAILAYDAGAPAGWKAARILTDEVTGDVLVDEVTGDVLLDFD